MFEHKNFAEIEPIVVLAQHVAIKPADYSNRASAWLNRAAQMLTEKRDAAYENGVGEENDLTFTQREIDFLIDGLERHSRKLAQDACAMIEHKRKVIPSSKKMTKSAKDIAEDLMFQAHHLDEQSSEFPECKARNDLAEKELNELEALFNNDDVDAEMLAEFNDLFEDDAETKGYQGYKRTIERVGFDGHFGSAEDFLAAAIAEMK